MNETEIYSAAFIFQPGDYDDDFHALDARVQSAADQTPGYLGREVWRSREGSLLNATYYWDSLDALRRFATHPDHLEAKRQYERWYEGYHVVVSKVVRTYGDGALAHITAQS